MCILFFPFHSAKEHERVCGSGLLTSAHITYKESAAPEFMNTCTQNHLKVCQFSEIFEKLSEIYSESIKCQMHKMWRRSVFPTKGNQKRRNWIRNFIHYDKSLRVLYRFSDIHQDQDAKLEWKYFIEHLICLGFVNFGDLMAQYKSVRKFTKFDTNVSGSSFLVLMLL